MIRFVDVTDAYYGYGKGEHCTHGKLCLFITTVTDAVLSTSHGDCIFSSKEEIMELGEDAERCLGRVPSGFFEEKST